jgi:hypothetical protein
LDRKLICFDLESFLLKTEGCGTAGLLKSFPSNFQPNFGIHIRVPRQKLAALSEYIQAEAK